MLLDQIPPGEILELLGKSLDSQIAFIGSDLRYRFANEAYHVFQGKPTLLLRGKTMQEVIGKEAFERIRLYVDAALRGEEQEFETSRRHPTSGLRHIVGRIIPDLQPDGSVGGFLEILRDVTEGRRRKAESEAEEEQKKRAHRAVVASEKRFRTMLDQSPISIQIFNDTGWCIHANAAWKQLWGAEASELESFNLLGDPQLNELGLHAPILKVFKGETVEIPAFRFDPAKSGMKGRPRSIKAMLYPIYTEQGETEVVLLQQDVTQEKEAEAELHSVKERLQLIVNTALDAVITVDSTGKITGWDGQASVIFGWTRPEALGLNIDELLLTPEQRNAGTSFTALVNAAGDRKLIELNCQRKTGSPFPTEVSISVAVQDGETFYSLFARDISERKRDQQRLRELNAKLQRRVKQRTEELRKASVELADFTYSVAHDLRNPLRRLTGVSSVLLEDFGDSLDKEAHQQVKLIRQLASDMTRIISDHIDFARLAQPRIHFERIDISSLVWSVIREIEPRYPKVNFKVRILPSLRITGDPNLLRILFENLLDNAAKFSQDVAGATVEIGTYVEDSVRLFYVRDNGIGFDPSFGSKIFDPFVKLHREVEHAGTGIGLANVHRIVERHGGRIWAQGEEGKGALFTFTLAPSPLEEKQEGQAERP